jgi:hypothetical protein
MEKFFGKNEFENKGKAPASPEEIESFIESVGPKLKDVAGQIDSITELEQASTSEKVKDALVSAKKAVGKVTKFTFTRLLPVYMAYIGAGHFLQKEDGKFSEKDRARKELEEKGITSEQASAYKLGMSDLIYKGVTPVGYPQKQGEDFYTPNAYWASFVPNLILGRDNYGVIGKDKNNIEIVVNPSIIPNSEDAWRMYLGLAQKNNTFGISSYQPKDSNQDIYYYKINTWPDLLEKFISYEMENIQPFVKRLDDLYQGDKEKMMEHAEEKMPPHQFEQFKIILEKGEKGFKGKNFLELVKKIDDSGCKMNAYGMFNNMEYNMGYDTDIETLLTHYTVSLGEDEKGTYLSYYDKWDLAVPTEESGRGFGRAFEIYDRIYYNPETGEIINNLLSK